MPLQALQVLDKKVERKIRLVDIKRDVFERKIEKKNETHKRRIGQKFEDQKLKFKSHIRRFEERKGIRSNDELRFFRTWIEKPLSMGSVTPSGKALARMMAAYIDPNSRGPIIELGPVTGPV